VTYIPPELRSAVTARAQARCEYCQLSQELQVATFPVDHVVPIAAGGETTLENLAQACPSCNARKWTHAAATDPVSGEFMPLFNPRTQAWADHFRWSEPDAAVIEATSSTGRATLTLLDLNSRPHVAIRRALGQLGKHPPG
jgi:HNH endonuclease